jgi:hypothetical protein
VTAAVSERGSKSAGPEPVDELVAYVIETTGTPVDAFGVAATLESRGLRDLDAVQRYGKRDIFELAEEVYERARAELPGEAAWRGAGFASRIEPRLAVRLYLRGAFSFLPLLLQVILLLTLGYSQWGWIHFSLAQASTVALGIGLSMLGTGAFIQALGYFGPSFAVAGKHVLARTATWRLLALGMLGSALLAGVVTLIVLLTGAYPARRLEVALVYDGLVSLLWLLNGALYTLNRHIGMLVALACAMPVVGIVLHLTGLGIYAAHWCGLAVSIAVELMWVALVLARRARTTTSEMRLATLPRRLILARTAAPLAAYGTGYFVLLLADRSMAWSVGRHPLPIWFNVRYELGLDVAMFGSAVGMAFLEVAIHAFSRIALPRQGRFSARDVRAHNRWFAGFYARRLLAVAVLSAAGTALAVGVFSILHSAHALGPVQGYYGDPVTRRVFLLGAVGYGLLAVGIAGSGVLFVVGRPGLAAWSVLAGAVVDLAAGYVLSRSAGFSYAAVGLTAGAATFALVSAWLAARVLLRADYYLYAAY